jgi:hypothetical protein
MAKIGSHGFTAEGGTALDGVSIPRNVAVPAHRLGGPTPRLMQTDEGGAGAGSQPAAAS